MVERLRGFRDFYPEDQEARRVMFSKMTETCREFGFREIDGPSLENIELFAHKSGEEIMNQMFSFRDKGGREVALIPEFTPTLARMVSSRKDLVKPIKWYSLEKFWRYEEPQSGRFREFYQLNADILGSGSYVADAEVTLLAASIMDKFDLAGKVKIKINSRILIDNLVDRFKPGGREDVYYILDRWNKLDDSGRDQLISERNLNRDLLYSFADGRVLEEYEDPEMDRLNSIIDYVKSSTDITVEKDLRIVRGIAYYTGYVFEVWDREEKFRAILGGGRYDNIIEQLGGERTPAVGFAVGDAVLENLLKMNGKWKGRDERTIFIANVDDKSRLYGAQIASELRNDGLKVDVNVTDRGISKQLDYASRMGYEYAVIIGENEVKRGTVMLKILSSGAQRELKANEIRGAIPDSREN
jgi:histidyl-tRNA synthetase